MHSGVRKGEGGAAVHPRGSGAASPDVGVQSRDPWSRREGSQARFVLGREFWKEWSEVVSLLRGKSME